LDSRYRIAIARPEDVPALAAIEIAAAELFRGHVPDLLFSESTDERELRAAQQAALLWVVLAADAPVGFALLEAVTERWLHLEEMDVHPQHGRRGIGAALLDRVCECAAARGYSELTLTTFRDVPWNMPFYSRHGFAEISADTLRPELVAMVADEVARGLDPRRRVAMRRSLR
jgi:GNAT superfamily N-acetyltransferase